MKRLSLQKWCLNAVTLMGASLFLPAPPSASGAVIYQAFERPLAPNINNGEHYLPPYVVDGKSYFFQWKLAPYALDLDGNGTTDFTFVHVFRNADGYHTMNVSLLGRSQIWAAADGIDGHYRGSVALSLLSGNEIGPSLFSSNPRVGWHNNDDLVDPSDLEGAVGNTAPFEQKYLGLRFERGGDIHYAWMAVSGFRGGDPGREVFIHAWAWESEPGKGILAGAIPEPNAGWLAMAGGWLGLWRRRRG